MGSRLGVGCGDHFIHSHETLKPGNREQRQGRRHPLGRSLLSAPHHHRRTCPHCCCPAGAGARSRGKCDPGCHAGSDRSLCRSRLPPRAQGNGRPVSRPPGSHREATSLPPPPSPRASSGGVVACPPVQGCGSPGSRGLSCQHAAPVLACLPARLPRVAFFPSIMYALERRHLQSTMTSYTMPSSSRLCPPTPAGLLWSAYTTTSSSATTTSSPRRRCEG